MSMMVMMRDQGIPLPAGSILISPWVDLTHSFPSVAGDGSFDYIPAHGFMQKPSASWPPPNHDEIEVLAKNVIIDEATGTLPRAPTAKKRKSVEEEALQGFALVNENDGDVPDQSPMDQMPGPGRGLSIEINGEYIVLKDQIQMYASNNLISHPLVSPVLQPSLGGLAPTLILTGGGEVLRDEQIYLAHKMAGPAAYSPGQAFLDEHDPEGESLKKHKPTYVQLQVWDDLCHVAPTLSFTRPAKYMYRSVAQFGAWALARAQKRYIEITDDDNVSIISSGESTSESSHDESSFKKRKISTSTQIGSIGKAGAPLPAFKNHMIRQRVDRHGDVFPLAAPDNLPGCCMKPEEVGSIKVGPVKKWLEAKAKWDSKYRAHKKKVHEQRLKDMKAGYEGFGAGEHPPPSALAGRRTEKMMKGTTLPERLKKSKGLMMWSMFGSEHDKNTIKREEEVMKADDEEDEKQARRKMSTAVVPQLDSKVLTDDSVDRIGGSPPVLGNNSGKLRKKSRIGSKSRSRSRRRTITVADQGQARIEESANMDELRQQETEGHQAPDAPQSAYSQSSYLLPTAASRRPQPGAIQRLKDQEGDSASFRTQSTGVESTTNASTMAVFSASGVTRNRKTTNASQATADGMYTPASNRSVERLIEGQDHETQIERQQSNVTAHDGELLRPGLAFHTKNASTIAFVGKEGVISVQDERGDVVAPWQSANGIDHTAINAIETPERPGLYDRKATEFKTAMEK